MSLFRSCEWWRAPSADDTNDLYDTGSMAVANVDNAPDGHDKIVTGSLQGTLRVYKPANPTRSQAGFSKKRHRSASGKDNDDQKDDEDDRLEAGQAALASGSTSNASSLVLEERLGAPILQVAVGHFCHPPGPKPAGQALPPLSLAILHPNKLLLAFVLPCVGPGGGLRLGRAHEHTFSHRTGGGAGGTFTAANMCVGPVKTAPTTGSFTFAPSTTAFIAVQSLDGAVCVYEGEHLSSRSQLAGVLLPAPFAHMAGPDVFAFMASDMVLHGYGHVGMATSRTGTSAPLESSPNPAWSLNIGEHANFMLTGPLVRRSGGEAVGTGPATHSGSDLAVIGTRTLFVIHGGGGGSGTGGTSAAALALAADPIRVQKRLDYIAVAACLAPADGVHTLCVASHNGVLHVYRETRLAWASRLPFIPCAMGVGEYGGTPGLLTLLSPKGEVAVVSLGTEPPTPGASLTGGNKGLSGSGSNTGTVDYARMQAEHRRLMEAIEAAKAQSKGEAAGRGVADALSVQVTVPDVVDDPATGKVTLSGVALPSGAPSEAVAALTSAGTLVSRVLPGDWERWEDAEEELEEARGGRAGRGGAHVVTLTLALTLALSHGGGYSLPLQNVTVSLQPPPWASVPKLLRSVHVPYIPATPTSAPSGQDATLIHIPVKARARGLPTHEPLIVVLSYWQAVAAGGATTPVSGSPSAPTAPRTLTLAIPLPLCLAARVALPMKSAAFKITIDTNRAAPPPLTALFPDMLRQPTHHTPADDVARASPTAATVLSFAYPAGSHCTILASKTGGRFRVQSGSFEGLLPITAALVARLRDYHASDSSIPSYAVSFTDTLPMADLGVLIDDHLAARHGLARAAAAVSDRAHEYRLVAKRLLVRFKDRSPAPLGGLDTLLEAAGDHVQVAADAAEGAAHTLASASARLSAGVSLLLLLLALRNPQLSSSAASAALRAHLSPHVEDSTEQGWEERTEAAVTALVKGGLNVGLGSTSGGSAVPGQMVIPEDAGRLKRVLAVLVDRLGKGATPLFS